MPGSIGRQESEGIDPRFAGSRPDGNRLAPPDATAAPAASESLTALRRAAATSPRTQASRIFQTPASAVSLRYSAPCIGGDILEQSPPVRILPAERAAPTSHRRLSGTLTQRRQIAGSEIPPVRKTTAAATRRNARSPEQRALRPARLERLGHSSKPAVCNLPGKIAAAHPTPRPSAQRP